MKANHGEVKEAVDLWLEDMRTRAPDWVSVDKAHGRIERREIWIKESRELGLYLCREYGWPGIGWSGRVRRYRKRIGQAHWEMIEEHTWVAGGALPTLSARQAARWLRGHWSVENGVFWVRDVSYGEDRHHARITALALSAIRQMAINVIRRSGFAYIPDGWRALSSHPDWGLSLLLTSY